VPHPERRDHDEARDEQAVAEIPEPVAARKLSASRPQNVAARSRWGLLRSRPENQAVVAKNTPPIV